MIDAACRLFERQGYYATGLSDILNASEAPKGSLYYYFPDGKEQLGVEAVERIGEFVAGRINTRLKGIQDPARGIRDLIYTIADQMESSGFNSGGPLTAVAMETAPARIATGVSRRTTPTP